MLYQLLKSSKVDYQKVKRTTLDQAGWQEKDLENLISEHIADFISTNALMTIFTERSWQEEADILALDSKGELYIFELKRWKSNQENILQVLRYGQNFGTYKYAELNDLYIKEITKKNNSQVQNLKEMHQKYFVLDKPLDEIDFNAKQNFLTVTNGLDQKTIESIIYWKGKGLSIDGIVYWVFEINDKYYIEFNTYTPIENQLEYEINSYVVNTNYTNNIKCHDEMIKNKKASAYYDPWKYKIGKMQKGDVVFLYQTGIGIVAFGYANGKLKKKDWDNIPENEYYMDLENFTELKRPMSASEMRSAANKGFAFRTTMYSIDEESKDAIIKEIKNKHL